MLTHLILKIIPRGLIILPLTDGETEVWKDEVIAPDACSCGERRIETGKNMGGTKEKSSEETRLERQVGA